MTDPLNPKTPDQYKVAAREFVTGIADLAMTKGIPFNGVVTLLGIYAKTVALTKMDQGTESDEAFLSVLNDFMLGLGARPLHDGADHEAPGTSSKVH